MKVRCINNSDNQGCLTQGKEYSLLKDGAVYYKVKNDSGCICKYSKSRFEIVNGSVNKDKEVSFIEAINAYKDGKTIYCKIKGYEDAYSTYINENSGLLDVNNLPISAREILKGNWFIEE